MKDKNDPTFLLLNTKIGGPVKCIKDKENICLPKDQVRHIYKKFELKGTMKQIMEEDKLSKNNIDDEEEINPYHNIIINNLDRENVITSHMEQWLILSNDVKYMIA